MKKTILAIGITILFIVMSFNSISGIKIEQSSRTLLHRNNTFYVGGSGPSNYTKIQDAIDNASDGDTIFVYNGTYYEYVEIKKGINLIGENKNNTIINSPKNLSDSPVWIKASQVKVDGFTLTNKDNDIISTIGIYISSSYNVVSNCIFVNNSFVGIFFDVQSIALYNILYGNTIKDSYFGIRIENSLSIYNLIVNNNFINNSHNVWTEEISYNNWDNGKEGNYWDDYNGTDNNGDGIGDTPYVINDFNADNCPLMEPYGDINPNSPYAPIINGSLSGKIGKKYEYTFLTTDPNKDDVYYYINWGDGTSTGWIGPYNSGQELKRSHKWIEQKIFIISARVKDVNDLVSPWGTLLVKMPRNKMISNLLWLRIINQYPLLQKILHIK